MVQSLKYHKFVYLLYFSMASTIQDEVYTIVHQKDEFIITTKTSSIGKNRVNCRTCCWYAINQPENFAFLCRISNDRRRCGATYSLFT